MLHLYIWQLHACNEKKCKSSFDNFSEKICQVPIYLNGNSSDLIMENNYTVAFIEMLVLVTKICLWL